MKLLMITSMLVTSSYASPWPYHESQNLGSQGGAVFVSGTMEGSAQGAPSRSTTVIGPSDPSAKGGVVQVRSSPAVFGTDGVIVVPGHSETSVVGPSLRPATISRSGRRSVLVKGPYSGATVGYPSSGTVVSGEPASSAYISGPSGLISTSSSGTLVKSRTPDNYASPSFETVDASQPAARSILVSGPSGTISTSGSASEVQHKSYPIYGRY